MAGGSHETYMARDGHEFRAWQSRPAGKVRGGVVVLQEIFGVNAHIRAMTDSFAAAGYLALAPSLFDRVARHVELGYTAKEAELGRGYMLELKPQETHADISACINVLRHSGKVALVGYCWGGFLGFVEAHDSSVDALVTYYATRLDTRIDRLPHCPTQMHCAALDTLMPLAQAERVHQAFPAAEFHVYQADHGFNCDLRPAFDAASAQLARQRTADFLARHVG